MANEHEYRDSDSPLLRAVIDAPSEHHVSLGLVTGTVVIVREAYPHEDADYYLEGLHAISAGVFVREDACRAEHEETGIGFGAEELSVGPHEMGCWQDAAGKVSVYLSWDTARACTPRGRDAASAVLTAIDDGRIVVSGSVRNIREALSEYGAWSSEQLDDDDENRLRIAWIACGDLVEYPEQFGLEVPSEF